MNELTSKQQEVLESIKSYYSERGEYPTLEEIGQRVGIESRSGVHHHLHKLKKKGYLSRSSRNRDITLKEALNFTTIPILGYANAGQPLFPAEEEEDGKLEMDVRIIKNDGNLFAVEVVGDSMNKQEVSNKYLKESAKLENGNYAIVDKSANYQDGDVVLAVIDDCATIKVLKRSQGMVTLIPNSTNPKHKPIFIKDSEDLFVNGKVVLAIKKPTL
jgi:repressor LexA